MKLSKLTWRDRIRIMWYNFTIAFFPTGPA